MTKKTLLQLCREAENLGIRNIDNAIQGKVELQAAIENHTTRTTQTIKVLKEAVTQRKGGYC